MTARPLRECFPEMQESESGYLYNRPYREDLLESMGWKIEHQIAEGSYQGISYVLLSDPGAPGTWGFISFGYGSCAGCDGLLGCDTIAAVERYRTNLVKCVSWRSTPEELVKCVEDDLAQASDWRDNSKEKFLEKVREIVGLPSSSGSDSCRGCACAGKCGKR